MRFTLRPYQQEMVNVAVKALQNSDKPFIIQAATGAGKSLVIAAICHALDEVMLSKWFVKDRPKFVKGDKS